MSNNLRLLLYQLTVLKQITWRWVLTALHSAEAYCRGGARRVFETIT